MASPSPTPCPLKARHILTIRPSNHNTSRLLQLPPELRDIIYWYALVEPSKWNKRHSLKCQFRNLDAPGETPPFAMSYTSGSRSHKTTEAYMYCYTHCLRRQGLGLLRTCKQLYEEASPFLWNENTFCFDDPNVFIDTVKSMPAEIKPGIRKLSLMYGPHMTKEVDIVMRSLGKLSGLTHLEIPIDYPICNAPVSRNLRNLQSLRLVEDNDILVGVSDDTDIEIKLHIAISKKIEPPACRNAGCAAALDHPVHPDENQGCLYCEHEDSRLETATFEWSAALNDGVISWRNSVLSMLNPLDVAHPDQTGRYITHITLANGIRSPVRVWGLPLLTPEARRKRRLRAAMLQRCEGKVWSSGWTVVRVRENGEVDDKGLSTNERLARSHRGGNRSAQEAIVVEQRKKQEARAQRRQDEAILMKQERKQAVESRASAEKAHVQERKAARKRLGRI